MKGPGTGTTAAERVYSRLKDEFGGRCVRVRGWAKVMTHLMFGILALSADQIQRWLATGQARTRRPSPEVRRGRGKIEGEKSPLSGGMPGGRREDYNRPICAN